MQLTAMIARINAMAKMVEMVLTKLVSNGASPNLWIDAHFLSLYYSGTTLGIIT
jgi:hypothetical protein